MTPDPPREPSPATPVTILVALSHDGTDVWQTTTGRRVRGNVYEILATPDFDPDRDDWEFAPGTLVECTPSSRRDGTPFLVAVRAVTPPA